MIILARYSQTEMCMQLSGADLGGGGGGGGGWERGGWMGKLATPLFFKPRLLILNNAFILSNCS